MNTRECTCDDEETMATQVAESVDHVIERVRRHIRHREAADHVADYVHGLLADVDRKNGWQLAEQAGYADPRGIATAVAGRDTTSKGNCSTLWSVCEVVEVIWWRPHTRRCPVSDLLLLRPLSDEETAELRRLAQSQKVEARLRERARICWRSHEG